MRDQVLGSSNSAATKNVSIYDHVSAFTMTASSLPAAMPFSLR